MTQAIGTSAPATVGHNVPAMPNAPAANGSLLPTPAAETIDVGDAITQLLKVSSQLSEHQMQLGKSQVDANLAQRKAAGERRKEALDRAIEAAKKAREASSSSSPFSFITDNIGLTGLIGIATFNWGLVAADVAAHRAELTGNSTNMLDVGATLYGGPFMYLAAQGAKKLAPEELGQRGVAAAVLGGPMGLALERAAEKIIPDDFEKRLEELTSVEDDDVRLANKIALMVAMAAVAGTCTVLSGGTTAPALVALVGIGISTATQVAAETGALKEIFGEKAATYIALGGAITGATLTLGGSIWSIASAASAASNVAKLDKTLRTTLRVVEGAKTITEGVSTTVDGFRELERAEHQRDADLANVDAEHQRHLLKRIEMVVDSILEDIQEAKESAQRATETLQATLQTHNQTALQAGSMKV
ncbi:MAG: hypothetical protein KF894_29155 [Labilithrix sp.]|nr:hypothetical protein [Labilithrix sp.]